MDVPETDKPPLCAADHATLLPSLALATLLALLCEPATLTAVASDPDRDDSEVADGSVTTAPATQAASVTNLNVHARVSKVFRHALQHSTAFQDLVQTLKLLDRTIYVDEGWCEHGILTGCVQLMSVPDGKHLLVRVHPRQPTSAAVAQLAHSLYHAGEIGREPGAVDTASIRALYTRIGERNCSTEAEDCWETRAAVAFEALVAQELNGISAPGPLPRRN